MKVTVGIIAGISLTLIWKHHWRPWMIALFARGD